MEVADRMRRMIDLERYHSSKLMEMAKEVRNPAIKAVLLAVSRDSMKHSEMYEAILELREGSYPALTDEEYEEIAERIEEHIRTEERMIREAERILEEDDFSDVERFLLRSILRDERIHHGLLRLIRDLVVRRESITEADEWEMIWKETPFHGAPGG